MNCNSRILNVQNCNGTKQINPSFYKEKKCACVVFRERTKQVYMAQEGYAAQESKPARKVVATPRALTSQAHRACFAARRA